MLVVDANVVLAAVSASDGFGPFGREELIAPPLLWPEARSALHVSMWRGLVSPQQGDRSLELLESGRVRERRHRRLGREAWQIADFLGWPKTYDAEYLALALLLKTRLATLDRRVGRAAERLGVETEPLRR